MKNLGAAFKLSAALLVAIAITASTAYAGPNRDRGSARHGGSKSSTPVLDALRNAGRNSDHPILDAIKDNYKHNNNHHNDHYDGHHGHDYNDARAYRDVGIANAIVDLVGIAANQPRYYAPAPVVYVPPPVVYAPRGYYRDEQVLVSPGHYSEFREWVPECRDSCGRITGGYYVMHRRWVPDVYETRRVWVEE